MFTTPYWDSKKSNPTIWCSCASRFEFSQKLFCSVLLRTKSNVLFSQRIRSNVLCFFAPIQMFYLLKGSKPVLCASLHQFRYAQRSSPMCFSAPNTDFLSSLCRLDSPNCITVSRFFPKISKLHHSLLTLL